MRASTDSIVEKKNEDTGRPIAKDSEDKSRQREKAETKAKPGMKAKKENAAGSWKGWLESMNELEEKHPKLAFWGMTAGFYALMMALFLYFMLANLSTAPKFVYTAF